MTKAQGKRITVSYKNQSGVVLVVSLIILVLLTLLGLTGMQTTSLEEKMAGNMRDKNMAFQAAEAALKAGEDKVRALNHNMSEGKFFNCLQESQTDGLFKTKEPLINLGADSVWSGTDVLCVDSVNNAPNAICHPDNPLQSKYVIQCMPTGLYRITAYAPGTTADAVVILQSIYNLEPGLTH
ncbi:PilX N-terminal domain-containing pilus assembly protein [Crenothrix sp.]|uniref:pilus assembly PilX family protein n=1 Tax=Crenothrix sp. TaxID=3100433 RepID=UPI00374CC124